MLEKRKTVFTYIRYNVDQIKIFFIQSDMIRIV